MWYADVVLLTNPGQNEKTMTPCNIIHFHAESWDGRMLGCQNIHPAAEMTPRERLFAALRGEPTDHVPVWLLFPHHAMPGTYVDVRNHPRYAPVAKLAERQAITLDRRGLHIPWWRDDVAHACETIEEFDVRQVDGGLLVQDRDIVLADPAQMEVVTEREPTEAEWRDLLFAWRVCRFVKSNAIVVVKNKQTVGVGPGQTNRVGSAQIAFNFAGEKTKGAVLGSDAFFPFSDCVDAAHEAGIAAIVQPGGSIRDQESIDACDKYGIAMVFTGTRHFRH